MPPRPSARRPPRRPGRKDTRPLLARQARGPPPGQPAPADRRLRSCSWRGRERGRRQHLVEGENLAVLKLLLEELRRLVKMIIDPPYNTGNDFLHGRLRRNETGSLASHDQADEVGALVSNPRTSGRCRFKLAQHDVPRLQLARNLLRPDGVIWSEHSSR